MNSLDITALLAETDRNGITFLLADQKLRLRFPKGEKLPPALLEEIGRHKHLILEHLASMAASKQKNTGVAERPGQIPLSFAQERLWFIDQLQGSIHYNMPWLFQLHGDLNVPVLEKAFRSILERHESLRTTIYEVEGTGFQKVGDAAGWSIDFIEEDSALALHPKKILEEEARRPFHLSKDILLRVTVIKTQKNKYHLLVVIHHLAFDGWSAGILIKELNAFYAFHLEGHPLDLPALPAQYSDYAIWQRESNTRAMNAQLQFWKQKLAGLVPATLPADFPRPVMQSMSGDCVIHHLEDPLKEKVTAFAAAHQVTPFMIFATALKILIYRYTGRTELCIGFPISGRDKAEFENLLGLFVNSLPLYTNLKNNGSFMDTLCTVRDSTLETYAHKDIPFEKIVENLKITRDIGKNAVFQIMLIIQQGYQEDKPTFKGIGKIHREELCMYSKFDIELNVMIEHNNISLKMVYCKDLFLRTTIEELLGHYTQILRSAMAQPDCPIAHLTMLGTTQRFPYPLQDEAMHADHDDNASIISCFERQANNTPDRIALKYGDNECTYQELNNHVHRWAFYISNRWPRNNNRIPLCITPGIDMIAGILAILKTGAAYVPIDPTWPAGRITGIMNDIHPQLILTDRQQEHRLKELFPAIDILSLTGLPGDEHLSPAHPGHTASSTDLAYIIYTSGSTGIPKGVMVEHGNVVRLFHSADSIFDFTHEDVWTLAHSYTFDFSVWEIFGALFTGARLLILERSEVADLQRFSEIIEKEGVTILNQTPSSFYSLREYMSAGDQRPCLRYLIFGGEMLDFSLLAGWYDDFPQCRLVNMYGITETTVHVTAKFIGKELTGQKISNIGQALPGYQCYILDNNNELTPRNAVGQLFVAGQGVSHGYLNQPGLTSDRFIPNPFGKGRLYKTGDLVRRLHSGDIEYLGREDDQVKVRGFRIELGEISSALCEIPGITQAVVLPDKEAAGNIRLIAYILTDQSFSDASVLPALAGRLPVYMIPSSVKKVNSFPITSNGKIDKKALSQSFAQEAIQPDDYTAPGNDIEQKLAAIWRGLLGVDKIGIHHNFFELGGHSLLVTRMVAAIRHQLSAEIKVKDIFIHPTIHAIAGLIRSDLGPRLLPDIRPRQMTSDIPLSFAQQRLWFIDRLHGSLQYHISSRFQIIGPLDETAFEQAFRTIVTRHESLRTIIRESAGERFQEIMPAGGWQMQKTRIEGPDKINTSREAAELNIRKPFDLSKDYMLRVELLQLSGEEHVVVIVMHHIASDGWSLSIMIKEMKELYNSFKQGRGSILSPLPVQYGDYAIWQHDYLENGVMDFQLKYWKDKLARITPLKLIYDFPAPVTQSIRGNVISHRFDRKISTLLDQFTRSQEVTPFMPLLAAFKTLLFLYTGVEDICIGIPIAGRRQANLEELIGFFVNTLAIRSTIHTTDSFTGLVKRIRSAMLDAYEHQDAPFEKVVEATTRKRDNDTNPLFSIMFALQNTPDLPVIELEGLHVVDQHLEDNTSVFDMVFDIRQNNGDLELRLRYCIDLFRPDTIIGFIHHFEILLFQVLSDPTISVGQLDLMSPDERKKILHRFSTAEKTPLPSGSVTSLFELQAATTPNAIAVAQDQLMLTYRQLNEKANLLSAWLIYKGIGSGSLVPVLIDRSVDLIITLLAVLKTGSAYVPVDPEYPISRISQMLADINADWILTTSADDPFSGNYTQKGTMIYIDRVALYFPGMSGTASSVDNEHADLCYVMYTSGSTGGPKGVMVGHRNVISLVRGITYVDLNEKSILLSTGSPSFDATTFEYWGTLLNGGQLVMGSKVNLLDNEYLKRTIREKEVNVMWLTASWFNQLVDWDVSIFQSLRTLIVGGEKLSEEHIEKLLSFYPRIHVVNGYGPTENTTFSLTYAISKKNYHRSIPIGRPLENRSAYIMGPGMQLLPVGVVGVLYTGGQGVARGYLNNAVMTSEKFIPHPFDTDPDARLYATGDLARWLPDGNIEFIGRKDEQIKIRGHRIELGEIETALNEHSGILHACSLVRKDTSGTDILTAYYVPASGMIRELERDLYPSQIQYWKELYEEEYNKEDTIGDDPEFNIIGWNDSFTGQPFPLSHMKSWLKDILRVILEDHPEKVLEIGTGTGLIYYALSEKIERYVGTDFSAISIHQIEERIKKGNKQYCDTRLHNFSAHEFELKEQEEFDIVILNSIIQYFPCEEYLTIVIAKSISALREKGKVVIGDVRDLRSLKWFKALLLMEKVSPAMDLRDFEWHLDQEALAEEELCVSPEYFLGLRAVFPAISHIEIQWKQMDELNELSAYRYTVIIYLNVDKPRIQLQWLSWEEFADKTDPGESFTEGHPLAIRDIPNFRLKKEERIRSGLAKRMSSVAELKSSCDRKGEDSGMIKNIIDMAISKGYGYKLLPGKDPLKMDIVFIPPSLDGFIHQEQEPGNPTAAQYLTSIPMLPDLSMELNKKIKHFLLSRLPNYMIPAELLLVDKLPLTDNGKIDRQFLSSRTGTQNSIHDSYTPPASVLENDLAGIWSTLLKKDRVGIHDDFFELGGHSLMATRLVNAIRKDLHIDVTIGQVFAHPTIAALAHSLQLSPKIVDLERMTAHTGQDNIPLSFAQERIWFIDQLQGSVQYNMPWVFLLEGQLDMEALDASFREVIRRHEVLRTVIVEEEGVGRQHINNGALWRMQYVVGDQWTNDELSSYIDKHINIPFRLFEDSMIRVTLIRLSEREHRLLIVLHHIAFDGWSMPVLIKEMVELYRAFHARERLLLPAMALQYSDYAIWQRKFLTPSFLSAGLSYWRKKLKGLSPLLLPTDHARDIIQSTEGETIYFKLDKTLKDQLLFLSRQKEVTLFMLMLSVFKVLAFRYTNQEDIFVAIAVANRTRKETEGLIGFFVNSLIIRDRIYKGQQFSKFLQQVKTTTLEAYTYQDVPFENIVESISGRRDLVGNPMVQLMFVLQNTPETPDIQLDNIKLTPVPYRNKTTKYEITYDLRENTDGIDFRVEYAQKLFSDATIRRMFTHYEHLLRAVVADADTPVQLLNMVSAAEKQQLLNPFGD